MLIYIHIPKNAGSTMRSILKRNYGPRYFGFYTPRRGNFLKDEELAHLIAQLHPQKQVISGHDIRPLYRNSVHGIDLDFATLIRHPVSRAVSLYYYEKKHKEAGHISKSDLRTYINGRSDYDQAINNWQIHNISSEGTFDHARELLDDFLMVGLVESFDLSLILLQQFSKGDNLKHIGYASKNVSKKKGYSSEDLPQDIHDTLIELNQEDLKLYEYAKMRLKEDSKKVHNMESKLKELQVAKRRAQFYSRMVRPLSMGATAMNIIMQKLAPSPDIS